MSTFDLCPLQAGPKKPKQVPTINADGHKIWKMTVKWSSIRTFAPLQRESAQKEVDHLFETLSTSVDWIRWHRR